jgi:hypothetical protein
VLAFPENAFFALNDLSGESQLVSA